MTAEDKGSKGPVLAVACGGTGGHFYPGLTIAREFMNTGGQSVLFIGGHHMDEQLEIARKEGMRAVPAPAVRLPRSPASLLTFPFRFLSCIRQNATRLKREGVDIALGMGSFASVPMGLAAVLRRIPLALHEGNASLGQANRVLSRWAKVLGLSFPLRNGYRTRAPQEVVGMPIRQQIVDAAAADFDADTRAALCAELGLKPDQPVALVFGGSQGARAINDGIIEMLKDLPDSEKTWQFIHLTGKEENPELEEAYKGAGVTALVKARDPQIERFYQLADGIICRSGASTVLELAIMGKAPLMIPFPGAKENHQMANALSVLDEKGGWLIPENELTPQKLVEHLKIFREKTEDRSLGIRTFAHPNAAQDMANQLKKLL